MSAEEQSTIWWKTVLMTSAVVTALLVGAFFAIPELEILFGKYTPKVLIGGYLLVLWIGARTVVSSIKTLIPSAHIGQLAGAGAFVAVMPLLLFLGMTTVLLNLINQTTSTLTFTTPTLLFLLVIGLISTLFAVIRSVIANQTLVKGIELVLFVLGIGIFLYFATR